jgi:Domain of unknown function (DUF4177)
MKRYEYKTVKVGGSWLASTPEDLVDTLNREGRQGWRLVPMPTSVQAWKQVVLERETEV